MKKSKVIGTRKAASAFCLTKYIHPIKRAHKISKEFNYYFDNPRNDQELEIIRRFLVTSYSSDNSEESLRVELRTLLEMFFSGMKEYDKYAYDLFQSNLDVDPIDVFCRFWIIIRYDDQGVFNSIINKKNTVLSILVGNDGERDKFKSNYYQLSNFAYLSSLLIQDDIPLNGDSYLLCSNPEELFFSINQSDISDLLREFKMQSYYFSSKNKLYTKWKFYIKIHKELKKVTGRVDVSINDEYTENIKLDIQKKSTSNKNKLPLGDKFIYIGELLNVVSSINDIKVKLLILTSIIEFLVTRSPDGNRFNVEDSISKQFKLKTSLVVHKYDDSVDLEDLKVNLGNIYNERSNVAHGNFKIGNSSVDRIKLVFKLYEYIKSIVFVLMEDRKFIDFIKKN